MELGVGCEMGKNIWSGDGLRARNKSKTEAIAQRLAIFLAVESAMTEYFTYSVIGLSNRDKAHKK